MVRRRRSSDLESNYDPSDDDESVSTEGRPILEHESFPMLQYWARRVLLKSLEQHLSRLAFCLSEWRQRRVLDSCEGGKGGGDDTNGALTHTPHLITSS